MSVAVIIDWIVSTGAYLQPGYEQGSLMAGNVHILTSYSNALMGTVCKDACSGHDVDKVNEHNMYGIEYFSEIYLKYSSINHQLSACKLYRCLIMLWKPLCKHWKVPA